MVLKFQLLSTCLQPFIYAGIDNAIVEINTEEVPIMDGSAKDFLEVIKLVELVNQLKKRNI